jgi:hypothetical protein
MATWGFTYKSTWYWEKIRCGGMGYWAINCIEELLIGTRGNVPAPSPGEQPPQVTHLPRGRHSEKPDVFAGYIEKLYPNVPKLEMFAREARHGWDVWGNEAEPVPAIPLSPASNVALVDAKTEASMKELFLQQAQKRQKAYRLDRSLKWRRRQQP